MTLGQWILNERDRQLQVSKNGMPSLVGSKNTRPALRNGDETTIWLACTWYKTSIYIGKHLNSEQQSVITMVRCRSQREASVVSKSPLYVHRHPSSENPTKNGVGSEGGVQGERRSISIPHYM